MSMNIKSEPFEESSSVVDLSSDEDDLAPEKNEIPKIKQPERPRTPETHCSICLEELTNKCYPDTCFHMFCFECLKRWSTIEPSCPLCKTSFKSIHHTLTEDGLCQKYNVPLQEREFSQGLSVRPFSEIIDINRIFRMNLFLDIVGRNERLMNNFSMSIHDHDHNHNTTNFNINSNGRLINMSPPSGLDYMSTISGRSSIGQPMRVQVYNDNVWAEPLPDLSGRFRDCNSAFYRENPAQTYRLHGFIIRDIAAIRSVQRLALTVRSNTPFIENMTVNEEFVTSLVMRSVTSYEIRDALMEGMLRPYLGDYTVHFCHELYNYANSPYDLIGYDRNVRYSTPGNTGSASIFFQPHPAFNLSNVVINEPVSGHPIPIITNAFNQNETIILDSDSDEIVETSARRYPTEIIVVSSSSDDSDVEILSHSFRPIETFDSNSRDQPSTSTGIRDSIDRPTNRYNFRSRRLYSPIESSGCPVHLSRMEIQPGYSRVGRIMVNSSSSDEESLNSTCGAQTINMKSRMACSKRKRKVKKTKKRKRATGDSRPENRIGNRSRSHSESSSSGDADTRPNNCVSVGTSVVM